MSCNVLTTKVHHYPFGSPMPNRSFSASGYRYGFNGKEKDDEINVSGGSYDFGARIYDSRLGKWLAVDPLFAKYPVLSPYSFCNNGPILFTDVDGRDFIVKNKADQASIKSALSLVFNNSSEAFTYDKRGKLTIDEGKIHGELSKEQKYLLGKIQDIATDKEVKISIKNVSRNGNETVPKEEDNNGKITKASILINVDHPLTEAKLADTESGYATPGGIPQVVDYKMDGTLVTNSPSDKVGDDVKRADILIHEIGHLSEDRAGNKIGTKANDQKTVGFENKARKILGLNPRIGEKHGAEGNKGVAEPSK